MTVRPGMPRRRFLQHAGGAVLASSLGGGLLAACGDDSAPTGEIGGTLKFFNYAGYDDPKAVAPFLKKYDVNIKSTKINNPDDIPAKLLAGGTGQFDLVTDLSSRSPQLVAADLLQEMDYERIPRTKAYFPKFASLGPKTFAVDGKTYVAPFIWGINGLVYNKAAVPTEPKSWEDLLAPEYKGKVSLYDSAVDNYGIWSRVLGYDPMTMTRAQFDETTDFLIDLKKNHARTLSSSYDDVADQLSRGGLWACASLVWVAVPNMAAGKGGGGKDVAWTLPKEGGAGWIDGWVIPKDAPNLETAYAFMNHMLGAKSQAILAENLSSGAVVEDALPLMPSTVRNLYPYDDEDLFDKSAPLVGFPPPDAPVPYAEWTKGWTRVQAA